MLVRNAARPTWRRSPGVAACVLLALLVVVVSWYGVLLVVAGHVVRGWAVAGVLLVAALVWAVVGGTTRHRPAPSRAAAGARHVVPLIVVSILAGLAGAGGALEALSDLGARYYVLEPAGPRGCRAVVRETSFLFSGSGGVYAVGKSGIGRRASSWNTDDGYRPIAAGSYDLHWGDGGGVLTVHGDGTDPVWPEVHKVNCP